MSFIHPVILTSESTIHRRSKQHIKLIYPQEEAQSTNSGRVSNPSFVRYQRLLIDLIKLLWTSDLCPWPEGMQLYNRGRETTGDKMQFQINCASTGNSSLSTIVIRRGMHSMYLEQEMKVKKWKLKLTLTTLKLLNGDAVYILPQATDPCKCLELLIVPYVFINSRLQKLQVKC